MLQAGRAPIRGMGLFAWIDGTAMQACSKPMAAPPLKCPPSPHPLQVACRQPGAFPAGQQQQHQHGGAGGADGGAERGRRRACRRRGRQAEEGEEAQGGQAQAGADPLLPLQYCGCRQPRRRFQQPASPCSREAQGPLPPPAMHAIIRRAAARAAGRATAAWRAAALVRSASTSHDVGGG